VQHSASSKQFVVNHLASVALVFGIFISSLTVVATLSLTGDLPSIGGDNAASVVPQASAEDAARRQLEMERNDFLVWQKELAEAHADIVAQRQLDMERDEYLDWQRQFAVARSDSDAFVPATAYDMEQRQLRMERDDFLAWQKELAEMR
jgi:hypothetical protein